MKAVNECDVPSCQHFDNRTLVEQLFSRQPNSPKAQEVYRTNKPLYDAARQEAIKLGYFLPDRIPVSLRPPE